MDYSYNVGPSYNYYPQQYAQPRYVPYVPSQFGLGAVPSRCCGQQSGFGLADAPGAPPAPPPAPMGSAGAPSPVAATTAAPALANAAPPPPPDALAAVWGKLPSWAPWAGLGTGVALTLLGVVLLSSRD